MLSFLCIDYIELIYTYLCHAQLLLTNNPNMWRNDYTSFYCRLAMTTFTLAVIHIISRYTDPPHIKVKKIELLSEICMFESAKDIVSELRLATDTVHHC